MYNPAILVSCFIALRYDEVIGTLNSATALQFCRTLHIIVAVVIVLCCAVGRPLFRPFCITIDVVFRCTKY